MGQLKKARIYAADSGETFQFYVQFNPNEISIEENIGRSTSQNVAKTLADGTSGAQRPQLSPFVEHSEARLSTKLFFNTYQNSDDYSDVRAQIKQFYYFFTPGKENVTYKKIGFAWGSLVLIGVLTSMQVSYSMFASDGIPVRAEVSISISGDYADRQSNEVGNAEFVTRPEKGSGLMERLTGYRDPAGWRELLSEGNSPLPQHSTGQNA